VVAAGGGPHRPREQERGHEGDGKDGSGSHADRPSVR
jgi:hypothetical protein